MHRSRLRDSRRTPLLLVTAAAFVCWMPTLGAQIPDLAGLPTLKDFSAHRSSSNNANMASNDDSKRPLPGETVVLADLKGPGVISHIWLTVAGNEYAWPRLLRIRVYYDGSSIPSVDAPLGDFFGVGHGMERPMNSIVVRNASAGRSRNEYWPMPFKNSAKVTITNEGRRRIYNLYYHVDWEKRASLPANVGYFHARYRQALPTKLGAPYEILHTKGRGHFVGTVFSVVQREPGWFGEGDDLFYVDGQKKPVIEGTGTEDYFNDAWSLRVADGPFFGATVADGTDLGARMTAYRWHLNDPVPFTKELRFDIEHAGWTFDSSGEARSAFEERRDLFSTVAFWYQQGIATDQPEPPYGAARLPHGNARQIEVEQDLARVKATNGEASVQKEVFWSKDILFLKGSGPGARIDVPFDVDRDGRYELIASVAEAPDYGTYSVLVDGKVLGASPGITSEPGANTGSGATIDGWYNEVFVGEDRLIGWPTLTKGTHTVSFVCTGKSAQATGYNFGIDALVLARVAGDAGVVTFDSASATVAADRLRRIGALGPAAAPRIRELIDALGSSERDQREAAIWSLGQMGRAAAPAILQLTHALKDESHVARGLAALALRDAGPLPSETIDALAVQLRDDPDDGVRMANGFALAAQGKAARRVLPTLLAVGSRAGEHRHVLRAVADVLGAIGPEAREAVPMLTEMRKQTLVRWNAEAALRSIQGR